MAKYWNQGSSFLGQIFALVSSALSGTVKFMVSAGETMMNYTLANVLHSNLTTSGMQPIPDPPDYAGIVGAVGATVGVIAGAIATIKFPADADSLYGFIIAVIGLGLTFWTFSFEASQPNGCNGLPKGIVNDILWTDIFGTGLTAPSFALDGKGTTSRIALMKDLSWIGLGTDVIGLATGLDAIITDLGCKSTAI